MEQHIFRISINYKITTEKGLQFIMKLKSIYNKNIGFIEQKMFFWTLQRGSNNKNLLIHTIFVVTIFSGDLFRAAPIGLCWY